MFVRPLLLLIVVVRIVSEMLLLIYGKEYNLVKSFPRRHSNEQPAIPYDRPGIWHDFAEIMIDNNYDKSYGHISKWSARRVIANKAGTRNLLP